MKTNQTKKPQPLIGKRQDTNKDTPRFKRFAYAEEDIKSACEFYLRYKDNPELLIKEHPEYSNCEVSKSIGTLKSLIEYQKWDTGGEIDEILLDEKEYNEWLFKLAFKDVLGEK